MRAFNTLCLIAMYIFFCYLPFHRIYLTAKPSKRQVSRDRLHGGVQGRLSGCVPAWLREVGLSASTADLEGVSRLAPSACVCIACQHMNDAVSESL